MSSTNPSLFVITRSNLPPVRTGDNGATFTPVTGLPNGMEGPWDTANTLAADPVEGNTFYYFHNPTGDFYRSTDGGRTFTRTAFLAAALWNGAGVETGSRARELYVWADAKGLFKSTDGGSSFTKVSNVLQARGFAMGRSPTTGGARRCTSGVALGRRVCIARSTVRPRGPVSTTPPRRCLRTHSCSRRAGRTTAPSTSAPAVGACIAASACRRLPDTLAPLRDQKGRAFRVRDRAFWRMGTSALLRCSCPPECLPPMARARHRFVQKLTPRTVSALSSCRRFGLRTPRPQDPTARGR